MAKREEENIKLVRSKQKVLALQEDDECQEQQEQNQASFMLSEQ